MSNLDVCAFAHEGKFNEVYKRIEEKADLVRKKDQVRFLVNDVILKVLTTRVIFCCHILSEL